MARVASYGSLADPKVQESLAIAQKRPDRWTVYLVNEAGGPRTPAQNKLLHHIYASLSQQLGKDPAYWRERLVKRFLGYEDILTEDGYTRQVLRSTSELSVSQFASFLTAIISWIEERGVKL